MSMLERVCPELNYPSLQVMASHTYADNPHLSWTSFYPAQAKGIFRWPVPTTRPLSGVRELRDALPDPGGSRHRTALTAVCRRCPAVEVRASEPAQGFRTCSGTII